MTSSVYFKEVDAFDGRNMTWTSKAPKNEGLKRIGIDDTNFFKYIGSTIFIIFVLMAVYFFGKRFLYKISENGFGKPWKAHSQDEKRLSKQARRLRANLIKQNMIPDYQILNCIIGVVFLKFLMGSFLNSENNYLITSRNFGPTGALSAWD